MPRTLGGRIVRSHEADQRFVDAIKGASIFLRGNPALSDPDTSACCLLSGGRSGSRREPGLGSEPSPAVKGYSLCFGPSSCAYTQCLDVGKRTSWIGGSFLPGRTYYFAVKAYDSHGRESPFSNEVRWTCQGCLCDLDRDGDVDSTDLSRFKAVFGKSGPIILGDWDQDGDVDVNDLAAFVSFFGVSCIGKDNVFDVDGDKDVDAADLNVFAEHFGQTVLPGDFDRDGDADVNDLSVCISEFGSTACK